MLPQDKEIEARRASLSKWKLELVHRALDTLDLPRGSGDKVGSQRSLEAALVCLCLVDCASLRLGDE